MLDYIFQYLDKVYFDIGKKITSLKSQLKSWAGKSN